MPVEANPVRSPTKRRRLAHIVQQRPPRQRHAAARFQLFQKPQCMNPDIPLRMKLRQRQPDRTACRWGSERGYCVVMGQKVPIQRPRVRTTEDKEMRLGSYEMFHRGEPLTETVWEKLMLGLSTRKYGQAVREFTEAYGLEKSAVSEHFIEASRAK